VAWRVRMEGGPVDKRSLVVPTLAEVFHWYDPWVPPPIDLSDRNGESASIMEHLLWRRRPW
jgi:hypothetical protein